ncbi:MAG: sigma-70 family RNA polymerase sigma factor [Vulcanimicrobiaceae bacterium]
MDQAEELVARVRHGDRVAFEALYDGYHRLVYGIALRMLGDAATAEDVTQTVFLTLWTSPQSFVRGNFGAWIARVTRNRALDVLRSKGRREHDAVPPDLPDDDALDDRVLARIEAERVRTAMAALPPEQRTSIELGFFAGFTHEEIARRTATPLGTVKARIRMGLHKLRVSLDGEVR